MDWNASIGKPKATLIRRFDGSAVLLGPRARKIELGNRTTRHEVIAEAENFGWVIAIEHLHSDKEHRAG